MAEVVHKEHPTGIEPTGDLGHQAFIVLHVLEHLNRDYPVEAQIQLDIRHIGGQGVDGGEA